MQENDLRMCGQKYRLIVLQQRMVLSNLQMNVKRSKNGPVQILGIHANQRRNISEGNTDETGESTLSHNKASNTVGQEENQLVGQAKRRGAKIRPKSCRRRHFRRLFELPRNADWK